MRHVILHILSLRLVDIAISGHVEHVGNPERGDLHSILLTRVPAGWLVCYRSHFLPRRQSSTFTT
jgi:hypothetical protein